MSKHAEHDISPKANLIIWGFFFAFVIALYLVIAGLNLYFRSASEQELYLKVGSVKSRELIELRQYEAERLVGVEKAMENVVRASN